MNYKEMEIEKVRNKLRVIGSDDEWIFNKLFNRKWKAKIALGVMR